MRCLSRQPVLEVFQVRKKVKVPSVHQDRGHQLREEESASEFSSPLGTNTKKYILKQLLRYNARRRWENIIISSHCRSSSHSAKLRYSTATGTHMKSGLAKDLVRSSSREAGHQHMQQVQIPSSTEHFLHWMGKHFHIKQSTLYTNWSTSMHTNIVKGKPGKCVFTTDLSKARCRSTLRRPKASLYSRESEDFPY